MPRSPRPSRLSASLTLVSLLTLTSCASPRQTLATSSSPADCAAFPRISYSRKTDSDETIREVKGYLAARDALCGVGK